MAVPTLPTSADPSARTRVWWDGSEVHFIRWSERGLIFNWGDPRETAIHMPRGALMRLMQKGVIRIEGDLPEWLTRQKQNASRAVHPLAYYNQRTIHTNYHAAKDERKRPSSTPQSASPQSTPQPVRPSQPPAESHALSPASKLSIVARLIRKLGGSSGNRQAQERARVPG